MEADGWVGGWWVGRGVAVEQIVGCSSSITSIRARDARSPHFCCHHRDDVLPCRVYLRHCVLAAEGLGPEAHASFLDHTLLADRVTTVRQHLERDPGIMRELPPPSLVGRYSG